MLSGAPRSSLFVYATHLQSNVPITGRLLPYASIGADAGAARGYVRMTRDFDVMTTDRSALDAKTWDDLRQPGLTIDISKGDFDDPLSGVVRV